MNMKKIYVILLSMLLVSLILCSCKAKKSNSIKKLNDSDFGVTFNNAFIKIDDSPDKMLKAWGKDESDIEEPVKTDATGHYQEFEYHFSNGKSGIDVEVRRGVTNFISYMFITDWSTNRGIKKGDSYDKLIKTYGEPSQKYIDDSQLSCEYNQNNKSLIFEFDKDKKIKNIVISYYK